MADTYSKVPACVDLIENAFSFTPELYQKWANLTNHPKTNPTDGSPPYTDQTYPGASEQLIGELTLTLSNDQGTNFTSFIPHFELVSQERGSDSQGKYAVVNATRAMAAVASSKNEILGQPLLGGTFLSQNYLVIDFERSLFGLAPAVLGTTQRSVACPATAEPSSAGKGKNSSAIALGVVLGLAIVCILILLLFVFRWWRKQRMGRTSLNKEQGNSNHKRKEIKEEIKSLVEVDGTRSRVEVDGIGPERNEI